MAKVERRETVWKLVVRVRSRGSWEREAPEMVPFGPFRRLAGP